MDYTYNVEEVPPDDVPHVEHDLRCAKKFLQRHSPESGDSLYDHLTEVLAKILSEKPKNAVDAFEDYSRRIREERFKTQTDHLRELYVPPAQYETAKKLVKLFQDIKETAEVEQTKLLEADEEEEAKIMKPDMMDLLFYLEQIDVGLPRKEMILLNLAIRKLMLDVPIRNVRFWGKVLGNPKNYYVVEAELEEDELSRRMENLEAEEESKRQAEESQVTEVAEKEMVEHVVTTEEPTETTEPLEGEEKEESLNLVFPPMPVNPWQPPPEVPLEKPGTGANTKVYFVCNEPGLDEWVELPLVTPQQIVVARQIVRYCTGNLDTPLHTFPPFPGTEKNFLRAQICRIGSTTQISPVGFFTFGGEDEEDEIGEEAADMDGTLTQNVHYDPIPVKDLVDPSMSNWCHHAPYILKQGRITWWDQGKAAEGAGAEEQEEVEEEEEEEIPETDQREVGPPLLTPLSEDAIVDSVIPWTAKQSSYVQSDLAIALVRSNIWPGAFTFASGKRFANVYVGWGQKYKAYNYSPSSMPLVQEQYKIGPEVMEMSDPTFDEEEAYRIAHLPPPPIMPMDEEEEMLGEEEEEEDED